MAVMQHCGMFSTTKNIMQSCYEYSTTLVLFCSLAIFDLRVGHTMDVLSPFISVLCHSNSSMGGPDHGLNMQ